MSTSRINDRKQEDSEEKRVGVLIQEVKPLMMKAAKVRLSAEEQQRDQLDDRAKEQIVRVTQLLQAEEIPFSSIDYLHDGLFPDVGVHYEDDSLEEGGYKVYESLGNRPYLLIALDLEIPDPAGFVPDVDLLAKKKRP